MKKASSLIVYGKSGTFKTSAVYHFARYIYEKTGKITRVISADGGTTTPLESLIQTGVIEPWIVSSMDEPISNLRKLSRGYWPSANGGKLLPPAPDTWNHVGGIAIEGLTSVGDLVMQDLRFKGPKLGQDPSYSFREGDETFFGGNQTYYGFVQDFLRELVHSFCQLPIEKVMWTALESKGEDDMTKQMIYGPAILGKKSISKAPAWFGDCIHHDDFTVEEGTDPTTKAKKLRTVVRAYFKLHPDPQTGVAYPAKPRVPPPQFKELEKKWPEGWFEPGLAHGLDEFLRFEDEVIEKGTAEDTLWKSLIDAARNKQPN